MRRLVQFSPLDSIYKRVRNLVEKRRSRRKEYVSRVPRYRVTFYLLGSKKGIVLIEPLFRYRYRLRKTDRKTVIDKRSEGCAIKRVQTNEAVKRIEEK